MLVHEAYLRLVGNENPSWDCRGHFFAAAGRAMRRILVERARHKKTQKRGGDRWRLSTDDVEPTFEPPPEDVLAVDEAIKRFERNDGRKGQIVNLRYFARMTTVESAAALGIRGQGFPGRAGERELRGRRECDEALLSMSRSVARASARRLSGSPPS